MKEDVTAVQARGGDGVLVAYDAVEVLLASDIPMKRSGWC